MITMTFLGLRKLIAALRTALKKLCTAPRKSGALPVRIKLFGERLRSRAVPLEFHCQTFDLSLSGAFLNLSDDLLDAIQKRFHETPHERCFISLGIKPLSFIQCCGEVVRCTPPRGKYPGGVGIRFHGLGWPEKRLLQAYLNQTDSL